MTDLVIRVATDEAPQGRATFDNFEEEADEYAGHNDEIDQAPQQPAIKLSLGRQDPVVTTGDPTLVEIALANALRNAIEAVLEVRGSSSE